MGQRATLEERALAAKDRPMREKMERARIATNRQLAAQANATNPLSRQTLRRLSRKAAKHAAALDRQQVIRNRRKRTAA